MRSVHIVLGHCPGLHGPGHAGSAASWQQASSPQKDTVAAARRGSTRPKPGTCDGDVAAGGTPVGARQLVGDVDVPAKWPRRKAGVSKHSRALRYAHGWDALLVAWQYMVGQHNITAGQPEADMYRHLI